MNAHPGSVSLRLNPNFADPGPCGHGVMIQRYQELERSVRDYFDTERVRDEEKLRQEILRGLRLVSVEWARFKDANFDQTVLAEKVEVLTRLLSDFKHVYEEDTGTHLEDEEQDTTQHAVLRFLTTGEVV